MIYLKNVNCAKRMFYISSCLYLHTSSVYKTKEKNGSTHGNKRFTCKNEDSLSSLEGRTIKSASEENKKESILSDELTLPEEPTTCCMSGCANCVWVEYAEQLCKVLKNGEKVREAVLSKVNDPNMRAFLLMELKNLKNKNGEGTDC